MDKYPGGDALSPSFSVEDILPAGENTRQLFAEVIDGFQPFGHTVLYRSLAHKYDLTDGTLLSVNVTRVDTIAADGGISPSGRVFLGYEVGNQHYYLASDKPADLLHDDIISNAVDVVASGLDEVQAKWLRDLRAEANVDDAELRVFTAQRMMENAPQSYVRQLSKYWHADLRLPDYSKMLSIITNQVPNQTELAGPSTLVETAATSVSLSIVGLRLYKYRKSGQGRESLVIGSGIDEDIYSYGLDALGAEVIGQEPDTPLTRRGMDEVTEGKLNEMIAQLRRFYTELGP